jgi:NADH-quinone oxidoreductase subunit N
MLSAAGLKAVMFYAAAYMLMNLGAFLVVLVLAARTQSEDISEYKGLGWRSPWLAAVMTAFLFSLTGIPPTAGFIGKVYLFASVIDGGLYWLAVVGVANSAISLYYYARIIRAMYFEPAAEEGGIAVSALSTVTLAALFVGTVVLGVYWTPLVELASRSTELFAGVAIGTQTLVP